MPDYPSDEERLWRMSERLLDLAREERVEWTAGKAATSYLATVSGIRFRIRSRDRDDDAPFIFELLTDDGKTATRVETLYPDADESQSDRAERVSLNTRLRELYELGRRKVLGIDEVIADAEKALNLDS